MEKYIENGADLSTDGRYRFRLWREWRGTHDDNNWQWWGFKDGGGHPVGEPKSVLFVMLNPSTADATADDATIRRCVGFAKSWRYERIEVVNLYAFRATKPADLWKAGDAAHHPDNQMHVERAARRAGLIIAAWGAHGAEGAQADIVRGWIAGSGSEVGLHCLKLTKDGHPGHPVRLPGNLQPIPFD